MKRTVIVKVPKSLDEDSKMYKKLKGKHKIDYFRCLARDTEYFKIRQRLLNGKLR